MREYKKPLFTTKHYEALAELLAEIIVNRDLDEFSIMEEFVTYFEIDNNRFNVDKFLKRFWQWKEDKIADVVI